MVGQTEWSLPLVTHQTLYDIFGVESDVGERDLRLVYKRKAMVFHLHKNRNDPEATEKFQRLNDAYDILKDSHKRQVYDQYGPEGLRNDGSASAEDIFSHLFTSTARTKDIRHALPVTLEDLYSGKQVTLKINRNVICPDCRGMGCIEGKAPKKCTDCGGQGQRTHQYRMGKMITRQIVIKHLDSRQLIISTKVGTVISPGAVKVIECEGMPQQGNTYQKGRLFVVFEINFSRKTELTPDLKATIATTLPPPNEDTRHDEGL